MPLDVSIMSAAQQVFDTNELLEIIICQVEPHQVCFHGVEC